jgi:hypothetical protein
VPCHDHSSDLSQPLVRPHYFSGRLLTADDFSLEQDYAARKRSIHDSALHGWGVVCGLDVAASDNDTVVVSAGIAIDAEGREIVVPQAVSLKMEPASAEGSPQEFDVLLQYAERAEPTETPEGEPTWIAESYELDVQPHGTAASDDVVLGQVRHSMDATLAVSGREGRRDAPSVQSLSEEIEELKARITALESQAHVHFLWSWLRRLHRRTGRT